MAHLLPFEEIPLDFYLTLVCDRCLAAHQLTEVVQAARSTADAQCAICGDDKSKLHMVWEDI